MPASIVRYRFEPNMQAAIEASRWWELSRAELKAISATSPDLLLKPTVERLADLRS
jgi:hypothetical protein